MVCGAVMRGNPPQEPLAKEQAVKILRSKGLGSAHSNFRIVATIRATSETKHVGEAAQKGSAVRKVEPVRDGSLISLLRFGGVVVLEFDSRTGRGVAFHIVTAEGLTDSAEIEGVADENEIREIAFKTTELVRDLLTLPMDELGQVIDRYFDGRCPTYKNPDDAGYFSVPQRVRNLGNTREVNQLGVLAWSSLVRQVRWSLSKEEYAANPNAVLRQVDEDISIETNRFVGQEGLSSDRFYEIVNLESISTHMELARRMSFLEKLNAYLEKANTARENKLVRDANLAISTLPVSLNVLKRGESRFFVVSTPSGIIVSWKVSPHGTHTLVGLTQSE
jgi:hypothetical protein